MKIIPSIVCLLTSDEAHLKIPAPPVNGSGTKPAPESVPQPERVFFANDDSPPGYKIRWQH